MDRMGKMFILMGLVFVGIGLVMLVGGRLGLFRLPGDFVFGGRNWKVYVPIATSIVLSALLTLALWLVHWFRR